VPGYRVKLAETAVEREQIHRLNYQTFVEEIPQHPANAERRLVDRFDAENEYVIALTLEDELAGMLALRGRRPFSLDQKLVRLDACLPPHRAVCELRLLAVRRGHRGGTLFRRLVAFAARRCIEVGYDLAVISGTTRQLELYRHLGFEPFGPLVGTPGARFQPMHLSLEALRAGAGSTLGVLLEATPDPASIGPAVGAAFGGASEPH
jgi:GNAT superfamily N-acetyltransferase